MFIFTPKKNIWWRCCSCCYQFWGKRQHMGTTRLLQQFAHYRVLWLGTMTTLRISAGLWRQMHSRACDTEQDACACVHSLPVISILAAGDKAQWLQCEAAADSASRLWAKLWDLQAVRIDGHCYISHHYPTHFITLSPQTLFMQVQGSI